MDFIKLLDVANPKNVKDTINLLIANYESFGDRVQEIADTAAVQAKQAVEVSAQAQQQIQANTTVVQGAAQDASNARQTSEEALAMIEQADARSTEATGLAEAAIAEAGEATSTAELAMNVANEAKSTIDQAIATGTFGSFLYNVNSIAMARAYLTDNAAQENTAEREYVATPKLVRDALANYYTKSETLSRGAIEILLNDKASQSAITQLSTALNNKVDKTIRINGQPLTQNIVLTAADVGALDEVPADYVTFSALDTQLESLLANIARSYYNKTDADGKFVTTEVIDEITESLTSIEESLTDTDEKITDMRDELGDKVSKGDFDGLRVDLGLFKDEVALDYYKKTDVDTKLTALFDRTTASSTGVIDTKCGFKIAGADGREMIVNIMTITSSSVHNFAIPFTTGYNYSNSLEHNGGNFRGERLYFSTRTLTGVAISSFSGPVHCIFVGY